MGAACLASGCSGAWAKDAGSFANIEVARTAKRGQPLAVTATLVSGGCETDGRVYLAVNEASRTVTVTGEVLTPYDNPFLPRACPTAIAYFKRSATFVPAQVGEYLVKAKVWPSSGQGPYDQFEPPIFVEGVTYVREAIDGTVHVQVTE